MSEEHFFRREAEKMLPFMRFIHKLRHVPNSARPGDRVGDSRTATLSTVKLTVRENSLEQKDWQKLCVSGILETSQDRGVPK